MDVNKIYNIRRIIFFCNNIIRIIIIIIKKLLCGVHYNAPRTGTAVYYYFIEKTTKFYVLLLLFFPLDKKKKYCRVRLFFSFSSTFTRCLNTCHNIIYIRPKRTIRVPLRVRHYWILEYLALLYMCFLSLDKYLLHTGWLANSDIRFFLFLVSLLLRRKRRTRPLLLLRRKKE